MPYLLKKGDLIQAFNSANKEGANYIMSTGNDDSLLAQPLSVATIMLHRSLDEVAAFHNLYSFSLSIREDAAKLTQVMHELNMQNGLVLSDNSSSSLTAIKELKEVWQLTNEPTLKQINISADFNLFELKTHIQAQQPNVYLIAGDSKFVKKMGIRKALCIE